MSLRSQLAEKREQGVALYGRQAEEKDYEKLLFEIQGLQKTIREIENQGRKDFIQDSMKNDEGYAYWDLGETTLSQLLLEYGSSDFLYIIPQELGMMKLQMFSSIPIPRESWNEMIELVLTHNGIGIKKLNPFLRQLYLIKHDLIHVEVVAHCIKDLAHISSQSMVFFVFSPPPEQVRSVLGFFDRFSDPKQVTVQIVGSKIVLVATRDNVERLFSIYEAVWEKEKGKVVRVIPITKIAVTEAEKIIKAFFQDFSKTKATFYQQGDELLLFPQGSSITLVGSLDLVERAEKVVKDLESQLEEPGEMSVYWYTCKHSTPEDLASVLEKVYLSLVLPTALEAKKGEDRPINKDFSSVYDRMTGYTPTLPVPPTFVQAGKIEKDASPKVFGNFIVDPKTGSIMMVVRKDTLEKLKSLIKKLDVPKKMVQIEVLLVEKRLRDRKQTGINLLKIGKRVAKNIHETSTVFDDTHKAHNKGILEFILSQKTHHPWPAFDLILNFLMAQDDIRINANPSILAVNQTPASISIVEEMSINNGAVPIATGQTWAYEKSYSRAQFGITIVMTPTVHLPDYEENPDLKGSITLQTNVNFDTTQETVDDRPTVIKRHIENEVCIADGETVILGGLRKKTGEDGRDKIPFLGDIPGIGKLFGTTKMCDSTTEMLIFITPKIIKDPIEDLRRERAYLLKKRPGDIPEFMQRLEESRNQERRKLFENSIKLLFDKL